MGIFGNTDFMHLEQHCLLLAKIAKTELSLTELDQYENWFETELSKYKDERSGVLSEGDLAAEKIVRQTIAQERASSQASLIALRQFETLEQKFPNLPRQ